MEQSVQNKTAAYKPSVGAVEIKIHNPTVNLPPCADNNQYNSQGYNYPQYQLMPTAGQQGGMMPVAVGGAGQPVYNQYYIPQTVTQKPVYNQYTMQPATLPAYQVPIGSLPSAALPQSQILTAPAVPQYQMPIGSLPSAALSQSQILTTPAASMYQIPVGSQYALSTAIPQQQVGAANSAPQSEGPAYNQYFISTPPQTSTAPQPAVQQPPLYPMMYPMIIPQYIPMPMPMSNCCCCNGGCNCNRMQQQQQTALPAQGLGQGSPAAQEQKEEPLATQSLQQPSEMTPQMPQDQMQEPPPGAQNIQPPQDSGPPNAAKRHKPQPPMTKTHLSDEYIKSLENYLNNPNADVRQTAIKEILKQLKKDKTLRDDPALTNLINKALRDRSMVNRTLALSILYGDYADGDDLTIKILKDMQKSNKAFNQDAQTANSLLLKRMGESSVMEEPIEQGFDQQAIPAQPLAPGFNPQMPPAQGLQNPQMQGPPLEQNFNPEAFYEKMPPPQQPGPQDWSIKSYRPEQSMQNPQLQSPQSQTGQNLNLMSR